ncbi:hypothetical protein L917_03218 [Phytophthora nicotianae]|uniref:Uncharacterized protein n=1 Tax=Phytophthora nicotianae TaxID=4792 RepID=W2LRG2_PHYNI|nr:hypothetical protein L917_03218 [Phytophthora nicotianae]
MVRRSNKCPKCEKRFPIHRNMKHHQGKEYACGYDYLKRVGRLHEYMYEGSPPPFIEAPPTTQPPPRRSAFNVQYYVDGHEVDDLDDLDDFY